jgi:hypothetical protein
MKELSLKNIMKVLKSQSYVKDKINKHFLVEIVYLVLELYEKNIINNQDNIEDLIYIFSYVAKLENTYTKGKIYIHELDNFYEFTLN